MNKAGTIAMGLTVSLLTVTCGSIEGSNEGDETHFQNCETDVDCRELGANFACIAGQCLIADGSDAPEVDPMSFGGSCELLPSVPVPCVEANDPEPQRTPSADCLRDSRIVAQDAYSHWIAADTYGAYWIQQGDAIRMRPHDATEPVTVLEGPPLSLLGLAVDEGAIYFFQRDTAAGSGAVVSIRRDGSGLTTLVSDLTMDFAPVLDGDRVYYANSSGQVASVNKLGGDPRETTIDARAVRGRLISDSSHFYWLEGDDNTAALKRMAKTGGAAELLATGLSSASSPAAVGNSIFLLSSGRLLEVPKTGGCALLLFWMESYDIGSFAVQGDQIYFESVFQSDLRYSRVSGGPITGGTTVQLAFVGEAAGANGIAVSAGRVYWTVDQAVHVLDP